MRRDGGRRARRGRICVIVKVCGVRSAEIAETAIEAGADWLGIVLEPRSVRHASDAEARAVGDAARGRADLVGVLVEPDAATCAAAADRYGLAAVQVHGEVPASLVEACPVMVIRGVNVGAASEAFTLPWWPDGLLLLDGLPEPGELPGGTGRRVPVEVAAELARHRRVLLAGGLGPGTVAAAVDAVRPHGVDASSGLERAPGEKDPQLVRDFVTRARAAFARLEQPGG